MARFQPATSAKRKKERPLPRPFTMPWGKGTIVEEAAAVGRWHEPTIQLLRYEDGTQALRFCSYGHGGQFQRSPLMVNEEELADLRLALAEAPRLRRLLKRLV